MFTKHKVMFNPWSHARFVLTITLLIAKRVFLHGRGAVSNSPFGVGDLVPNWFTTLKTSLSQLGAAFTSDEMETRLKLDGRRIVVANVTLIRNH